MQRLTDNYLREKNRQEILLNTVKEEHESRLASTEQTHLEAITSLRVGYEQQSKADREELSANIQQLNHQLMLKTEQLLELEQASKQQDSEAVANELRESLAEKESEVARYKDRLRLAEALELSLKKELESALTLRQQQQQDYEL